MATIIQLRHDKATNWATNNPLLAAGEVGLETDTKKMKMGDGLTRWNSLSYFGGDVTSVNGQTGAVTLSIPDDTSDLTNGAGFITSSALSGYATETWVDNQGYITSSDIPVTDVQINSTSILSNGVANIPVATNSTLGVVKGLSGNNGITVGTGGVLYTVKATDTNIDNKSENYKPIVPANLDYAVKVGVTTNTNTLTDAEKLAARTWIGAEAQSTIQALSATDSITLADNTIYNGGTQTALTITLPSTVDVSFLCEIDFTSGTTATTLTYSNTIKWAGDDVNNNIFLPVASKRYTIICAYDGVNYRFTVKGV